MSITWVPSIERYFQVDNYPRWLNQYPLIGFILDSQVAFGTRWIYGLILTYGYYNLLCSLTFK
jgi:hypothetical protein